MSLIRIRTRTSLVVLCSASYFCITPLACGGIDFSKPFKKAVDWSEKQSGISKAAVASATDPKQVATAAIDEANAKLKEAYAEQEELIKEAKEQIEFREKIFSATLIGLAFSNLFTAYTLFSGRHRRKAEIEEISLRSQKLRIEIEQLTNKQGTPAT
jgi:hypothetical protein